jgi:hypothetical protein
MQVSLIASPTTCVCSPKRLKALLGTLSPAGLRATDTLTPSLTSLSSPCLPSCPVPTPQGIACAKKPLLAHKSCSGQSPPCGASPPISAGTVS